MKLKKIELNGGIRLSEVEDDEWIYKKGSVIITPLEIKKNITTFHKAAFFSIIRDNKIINIIKDEEYDNEKPYIIKKNDIIVGLITYVKSDSNREKSYYSSTIVTSHYRYLDNEEFRVDFNELISMLDKEGFEVYKQE